MLSFCLGLFLMSCKSAMDIQYEKNFDLSSYKTYNFYPIIDSKLPEDETKTIMQAVELQLFKQGYKKSETPDFYVNFFVEENTYYTADFSGKKKNYTESKKEKVDSSKVYLRTTAIDQLLYLDIVDVQNDQLAWNVIIEGSIEDPITYEKLFQYYSEKIEKALIKFYETSNQ